MGRAGVLTLGYELRLGPRWVSGLFANRTSWHGRERLTGFTAVRNTLMLLFQQVSPREYVL